MFDDDYEDDYYDSYDDYEDSLDQDYEDYVAYELYDHDVHDDYDHDDIIIEHTSGEGYQTRHNPDAWNNWALIAALSVGDKKQSAAPRSRPHPSGGHIRQTPPQDNSLVVGVIAMLALLVGFVAFVIWLL